MDTPKKDLIEASEAVLKNWEHGDLAAAVRQLAKAHKRATAKRTKEEEKYFYLAEEEYEQDGDLEFDEDAVVSVSEDGNGAYVQAWKWIERK